MRPEAGHDGVVRDSACEGVAMFVGDMPYDHRAALGSDARALALLERRLAAVAVAAEVLVRELFRAGAHNRSIY